MNQIRYADGFHNTAVMVLTTAAANFAAAVGSQAIQVAGFTLPNLGVLGTAVILALVSIFAGGYFWILREQTVELTGAALGDFGLNELGEDIDRLKRKVRELVDWDPSEELASLQTVVGLKDETVAVMEADLKTFRDFVADLRDPSQEGRRLRLDMQIRPMSWAVREQRGRWGELVNQIEATRRSLEQRDSQLSWLVRESERAIAIRRDALDRVTWVSRWRYRAEFWAPSLLLVATLTFLAASVVAR